MAERPKCDCVRSSDDNQMVKSTLRTRVIGKNDDFTRQSTPVSGLEGLLIQLAQRLAAAADMPVTQLMGMSPAGMNATGESDTRGWYDRVEVVRDADLGAQPRARQPRVLPVHVDRVALASVGDVVFTG